MWLLFRRSLDSKVFPSILKISSVNPIFKSGYKANVKNYKPLSILSHISKLFEQLVLRSIQSPVNSILIDEQYGFRPSRSATMNLMAFNNSVLEAVEKHIQVDVIYTDFAKGLRPLIELTISALLRPYTNLGLVNHFCRVSNPIWQT